MATATEEGDGVLARAIATVAALGRAVLDERDLDIFVARAEVHLGEAAEALAVLYGVEVVEDLLAALLERVLAAAAARPEPLRRLDRRREVDPGWFQSPRLVGYVCYVDRFAGDLRGIEDRLGYLSELGVTYLHLMPLLRTRPGENDGGYAVMDYRAVEPSLGDMDELAHLAGQLRARGISLCVDVVLNHTAYEHEWAAKARAGDPTYRDYYRVFPDRTMPDAYETTLHEVFPTFAPGSFTWDDDLEGWVWTTFNRFQWDLNYENPAVFAEMLDVMLFLANQGVEILRLDVAPFTWKRLGTDCLNQPEAHRLLQAWRALVRIAAPAVLFKAEAIVAPEQLVPYLGGHERFRPECDFAYNNQLMVLLWSCLATGEARLATEALHRMLPIPPTTSWCTYVRCHDDIGWAIADADAAAVGWSGFAHRRYLADFYAGRVPGSFGRGSDFQANPATGDVRTSGTAASLCGIEAALDADDPVALDAAVRRLVLLHAVALSYGGVPLLYMGDELALRNDHAFAGDPARSVDNRWLHRPEMDWAAAGRRGDPTTLEGEVFGWFRRLLAARTELQVLDAAASVVPWWSGDDRVLAYHRRHPRTGPFLALVNVSEQETAIETALIIHAGLTPDDVVLASEAPEWSGGRCRLAPLSFVWLAS